MKATTDELINTVEKYKNGAGDGTEFMDVCIIALRALNKLNKPTTVANGDDTRAEPALPILNVSDSDLNEAFKNGYKTAIDNLNACYKDIFD